MRTHQTMHYALRLLLLTAVFSLLLGGAAARAGVAKSGFCGESLIWMLMDDGLLTISGTGDMKDYYPTREGQSIVTTAPWGTAPTRVEIQSGVTGIGVGAFVNCGGLTEIAVPDSVTSIGMWAFSGCSGLKSVTIPFGVTSIGECTFYECGSLTGITIPGSVYSIGDWAFAQCAGLNSVTLPDSVRSIGQNAFYWCSGLTSIRFSEHITSIGANAFAGCTSLTGAALPGSVTSIGEYAFYWCPGMFSISIPASVTSIGDCALSDCYGLQYIEIDGRNTAFGSNVAGSGDPKVYCYQNSTADQWAAGYGYSRVYLDHITPAESRVVSLPETYRLECGHTAAITPAVIPAFDHPSVSWRSSAPEIVSVNKGVLTAIAPGTAVITASVDQASASMEVTSFIRLKSFDLPAEIWVEQKGTANIECANVQPANAELNLTWSTGDGTIATVDQNGRVYGGKPGDAVITAQDFGTGIKRKTTVHVCHPIQAITFDRAEAAVGVGGTVQLKARAESQSGIFENMMVTFSSSDQTIAAVNGKGLVTGKKCGTAVITAEAAGGAKAEMTIRVADAALPASLTRIPAEAFAGLAWKSVLIPDGCTSIGSRAFADCKNLQYVRIPASVTSIAEDAFDGCGQVVIDRAE